MAEKIKVVMIPTDRPPYVTNISNSLENMQKVVGGYIETLTFATDATIVMNEEGRLLGLPFNVAASTMFSTTIVGDCFVAGVAEDEFCDVPESSTLLKNAKDAYIRGIF